MSQTVLIRTEAKFFQENRILPTEVSWKLEYMPTSAVPEDAPEGSCVSVTILWLAWRMNGCTEPLCPKLAIQCVEEGELDFLDFLDFLVDDSVYS